MSTRRTNRNAFAKLCAIRVALLDFADRSAA
jgi:hypothetical protein